MRKVIEQLTARASSDGDGVKLQRVFGGRPERFDPFLMMDDFGTEEPSDYIGGFPAHPHRGFETITYMLQGKMEHRDHMGNIGLLEDSDVQWMTAGKGIIHSEMPKQTEGAMRGFQVWLNLPASKKMSPARYQDVPGAQIPEFKGAGFKVKALAGNAVINDVAVTGFFDVPDTQAIYLDLHIRANETVNLRVAKDKNLMIYIYENEVVFGEDNVPAKVRTLSRFSPQITDDETPSVNIRNNSAKTSKLIVLAGTPLKEPIAQYGPFVMNTDTEINQAIEDYQNGVLTD